MPSLAWSPPCTQGRTQPHTNLPFPRQSQSFTNTDTFFTFFFFYQRCFFNARKLFFFFLMYNPLWLNTLWLSCIQEKEFALCLRAAKLFQEEDLLTRQGTGGGEE